MTLPLQSVVLDSVGFKHGFLLRPAPHVRPADLSRWVEDPPAVAAMGKLERATGEALFTGLGIAPSQLHFARQVHGVDVLCPASAPAGCAGDGDALVIGAGHDAVGVVSADCVPLLVGDPRSGAAAAVHAGWRGLVGGVVPAAVEVLRRRHGAAPSELRVAVFPHIRGCCFEIGEEVAAPLAAVSPQAIRRPPGRSRPFFVLAEALLGQLQAEGVRPEHIDEVKGCTCCDAERFVSYRRDGVGAGRHWAVIASRS